MRVALPSGFSTSSPRCRPSRARGVYDATGRDVSATSSSSSVISRAGIRETRSA